MPIVAQNWYNEAVDAWTTGATIPNLPGYVEVREKQAERLADGRARAPERAPRGSKVKVEKQPRTASKTQILQRHIIANVGESKEAYAAFASTLELKTSTANMYRMLVLNVLKYAEEAGWERPTTSAQLPDDAEEEGDLEEVGAEAA